MNSIWKLEATFHDVDSYVNWWINLRNYQKWGYIYEQYENHDTEINIFYKCEEHRECDQKMKKIFYLNQFMIEIYVLRKVPHSNKVF